MNYCTQVLETETVTVQYSSFSDRFGIDWATVSPSQPGQPGLAGVGRVGGWVGGQVKFSLCPCSNSKDFLSHLRCPSMESHCVGNRSSVRSLNGGLFAHYWGELFHLQNVVLPFHEGLEGHPNPLKTGISNTKPRNQCISFANSKNNKYKQTNSVIRTWYSHL